jgi:hypothetical protein
LSVFSPSILSHGSSAGEIALNDTGNGNSDIDPHGPTESFIRKKLSTLHRGDVKTLAASSIAVASSIGSPSLNQSYPPSSDEQKATHTSHPDHDAIGQESSSHRAADSAWQTAYSTARMVIDIAKESSDMLLPLKAIVGALSVLIKNYDVSPIPVTTELFAYGCALANNQQCEAGRRDRREGAVALGYTPFSSKRR